MSWIAAASIIGGATIGGALIGSSSASKAAKAQAAAAAAALAEEKRQYDINRADFAPWREAGQMSLGKLRDLLGIGTSTMSTEDLMKLDPGYQFRMDQGTKALRNMMGSRGMLNSGATGKALTRYGQDYASGEFGNIYNRFAGLSGTGMTATGAGAGLGSASAGRMSDILTGMGNARGAAGIAQGNIWGNALGNIGSFWNQQNMMNKMFPTTVTPTATDWMGAT